MGTQCPTAMGRWFETSRAHDPPAIDAEPGRADATYPVLGSVGWAQELALGVVRFCEPLT
jgi:hypothetical protein